MENIPNVNQILIDEIRDLKKDVKLLLSFQNELLVEDKFDVSGFKEASKKYGKCPSTIKKRIKEGVLKENVHFRVDDNGYYEFNEVALLSARGLKSKS